MVAITIYEKHIYIYDRIIDVTQNVFVITQTWVYKIEKSLRYETERSEVKNHSQSEWENSWGPGGTVSPPVGSRGKAPCRVQRQSPGKFLVYKVYSEGYFGVVFIMMN